MLGKHPRPLSFASAHSSLHSSLSKKRKAKREHEELQLESQALHVAQTILACEEHYIEREKKRTFKGAAVKLRGKRTDHVDLVESHSSRGERHFVVRFHNQFKYL